MRACVSSMLRRSNSPGAASSQGGSAQSGAATGRRAGLTYEPNGAAQTGHSHNRFVVHFAFTVYYYRRMMRSRRRAPPAVGAPLLTTGIVLGRLTTALHIYTTVESVACDVTCAMTDVHVGRIDHRTLPRVQYTCQL